jgi:hypothetical protein
MNQKKRLMNVLGAGMVTVIIMALLFFFAGGIYLNCTGGRE